MKWQVEVNERAESDLRRLAKNELRRVVAKLQTLEDNPLPQGIRKLKGHTGYRLRVGNYRILYEILPDQRQVIVYAIGHRRDVYR